VKLHDAASDYLTSAYKQSKLIQSCASMLYAHRGVTALCVATRGDNLQSFVYSITSLF